MDLRCVECGNSNAANFDISRYDTHGEKRCLDCDSVVIEEDLEKTLLDSSPAPFKGEGDTRAGGPITEDAPGLDHKYEEKEGDREWGLPPPRKRGLTKRKQGLEDKIEEISVEIEEIENKISQIESEIDAKKIEHLENWLEESTNERDTEAITVLIEKLRNGLESVSEGGFDKSLIENLVRLSGKLSLEEDVVELSSRIDNSEDGLEQEKEEKEIDLVDLFDTRHGTKDNPRLPPPSNIQWMDTHRARNFLGLNPNQDEAGLAVDIKELEPNRNWITMVAGIIGKSGLPNRAPIGEDGRRMWTPRRERIGIEVFATLSAGERGFWFFFDYIQRLGLNDKRINRILRLGLPLNHRLFRESSDASGSGFVSRCSRLIGKEDSEFVVPDWYSRPPEVLWRKLALGERGTNTGSILHFWVPHERGRKGRVRQYPNPLILSHVPLAYYVAQELWCRRENNFRVTCSQILEKIAKDLEWCAASVEEMDAWWDSAWESSFDVHRDKTASVTQLRFE